MTHYLFDVINKVKEGKLTVQHLIRILESNMYLIELDDDLMKEVLIRIAKLNSPVIDQWASTFYDTGSSP